MKVISVKKLESKVTSKNKVEYFINDIKLNDLIGNEISLSFTASINCLNCSKEINKTYNQGYCFECFSTLARCDMCILKPELCHYDKGTCREPNWGETHCMIDHVLYISNTTGVKVGITRAHQKLTRWVDQGAIQAMPLAILPKRKLAGELEVELARAFSDKTNWRKLITGEYEDLDMLAEAYQLLEHIPRAYEKYLIAPNELKEQNLEFPVVEFLKKAKTHNFDKTPNITSKLQGIKGQYLIFENTAINFRKYQGYQIKFEY